MNRRGHWLADERENTLGDVSLSNDFEHFCSDPRTGKIVPLQWIDTHTRFPVPPHMAFDLLAALASSDVDERVASMADNVLNRQRSNTQDDLAEATQCLKSWYLAELV
jgi:hypothetical protein